MIEREQFVIFIRTDSLLHVSCNRNGKCYNNLISWGDKKMLTICNGCWVVLKYNGGNYWIRDFFLNNFIYLFIYIIFDWWEYVYELENKFLIQLIESNYKGESPFIYRYRLVLVSIEVRMIIQKKKKKRVILCSMYNNTNTYINTYKSEFEEET